MLLLQQQQDGSQDGPEEKLLKQKLLFAVSLALPHPSLTLLAPGSAEFLLVTCNHLKAQQLHHLQGNRLLLACNI